MFKIDNKNLELTKEEIFVGKFILEKVEGHYLGIKLEFINKDTNKKGYINLDVDYNLSKDKIKCMRVFHLKMNLMSSLKYMIQKSF